jgi:hypothetical protein
MKTEFTNAHFWRAITLAAALPLTASSPALGAIVFSDDFSTNGVLEGQPADIGGTWEQTGGTATNPVTIVGGVAPLTTGQDVYAAFTGSVLNSPGPVLVTRADVTVASATSSSSGEYLLHLSDPVGTTNLFYQRLFIRSSGGGILFGLLDTTGTNSATTWGTTVLPLNTSHHVEITWNFVAGPTNDTFDVSVDGSPYLTHAWTSDSAEPSQISAANLRQAGASSFSVTVDNYVVEQVPEPSTLVLAGAFGLAGLARRKQSRRSA